jgi:hypothetical protein
MEHIIDTFSNGLKNLFKNPVIFLPFLIFFALTIVLSIIWVALVIVSTVDVIAIEDINWVFLGATTFIYLALIFVLSSYVSAGTIGMSKEVISTGKTKLSDMFTYGNKYTIRFIFANIILAILQLVAVIFWLPLIYVCMNSGYTLESFFEILFSNPDALVPFFISLILPILLGSLLTFIYLIILYFLFYFAFYAIIVDNMSVIASFKKSYAMLRQSFWKVIAFILAVYFITAGITSIFYTIYYIFAYSMLPIILLDPTLLIVFTVVNYILEIILAVLLLILSIIVTVWTTRFYMSFNDHELYVEEAKENLLETDF